MTAPAPCSPLAPNQRLELNQRLDSECPATAILVWLNETAPGPPFTLADLKSWQKTLLGAGAAVSRPFRACAV